VELKTIAITGANSGIGYWTALKLAQQGQNVIMICRSAQRGEAARQKIVAASKNDRVDLLLMDLSSQQSIRDGVAIFNNNHSQLDVLINNAANFDISQKQPFMTDDRVEAIFATNHLGPFLLTQLLLPVLKASQPARVINIASKGLIAHPFLKLDFDNLHGQKKYSPEHAYYQSKLAQIIFSYHLAEKLENTEVTVNCIRVPAVQLEEGRFDHIPPFLRAIYRVKMKFSMTAEAMADAYVRLTIDPEFKSVTGRYIDENGQEVKSPRQSYDRETWEKLWQISTVMTRQNPVI